VRAITAQETFRTLPAGERRGCLLIGKLSHLDPLAFQLLISKAHAVIDQAKKQHIPVILDYTDDLVARGDFRNRPTLEMLLRADAVVCASQALADRVSLYLGEGARVGVIPDPVEGTLRSAHASALDGDASLRLLWFGHPASFQPLLALLHPLDVLARSHPLELEILTNLPAEQLVELQLGILGAKLNYPIQFSPWESQRTVFEALERSHVVLLPVDPKGPKAGASNNRLTEALWGGCFVVASPLASYGDFQPFTWQGDDLIEGLRWFLDHRQEADRLIEQAQEQIARSYTPEAIADRWEEMLRAVEPSPIPVDALTTGLAMSTAPRLNLGCGNHPLPGYLNIDIVPERAGVQPDLSCDIRNLSLLPYNYAAEILAVHVVEHFWRWEIEAILAEWIRVLRPGGKLILECPNLLSACEELLKDPHRAAGPGREGQRSMWVLYGDPAWQDPLMCHRWGYTPNSLIDLLTQVGLVAARQEPAMFKLREPRDMRITAIKPSALTPSPSPPSA
jgi:glycosyltransferase involved in cell wall biosynthesis